MERTEIILATLSRNPNCNYSPVKVQKLFFLIDRLLSDKIGQTFFNFIPYHYGPFDKDVYNELQTLSLSGYISISSENSNSFNLYLLTQSGKEKGDSIFSSLTPEVQDGLKKLCDFVISLSFTNLISTIYKNFPDMKVNSIFNG